MPYFFREIRRLFTYNLKFTYVLDDDDYEDEETAEDDQSEETDNTMFERECDLYEISSAAVIILIFPNFFVKLNLQLN